MRLTLRLLGLELVDLYLATDEPADDCERDLSGGVTGSMPISLTWTRGDGMGDRPEWGDED